MVLSRTKVRSTECPGHVAHTVPSRKAVLAFLVEDTAWPTRGAPGKPARLSRPGRVAHPEAPGEPAWLPRPGRVAHPGAPGEPARLPRPGRVAHPGAPGEPAQLPGPGRVAHPGAPGEP